MELRYKYKTMSVAHLKELQEDINKLDREGKLIDNEWYRGYVGPDRFTLPETFPDARYLIIIAQFSPMMLVDVHLDSKKCEVKLPPECYYGGVTDEMWTRVIEEEIIRQSGYKIERVRRIPLKLLAVRSGLGRYGRNNICYVDEMGSFLSLFGFFTDFEFPEDNWQEIKMMDTCKSCRICMNECPCECIREENFVIDALKCVTWYNEKKEEFPAWIDPGVHNALIGCMKCQISCPANVRSLEFTGRFDDLSHEETMDILNGRTSEDVLTSTICEIFGIFTQDDLVDSMPILTRNLSVLLK